MLKEKTVSKLRENVIDLQHLGVSDVAWERNRAIELLESFLEDSDEVGILGGDVCNFESGNLQFTGDSWSVEPRAGEKREDFYRRNITESLKYLNKYPLFSNESIIFTLVLTDNFIL